MLGTFNTIMFCASLRVDVLELIPFKCINAGHSIQNLLHVRLGFENFEIVFTFLDSITHLHTRDNLQSPILNSETSG